MVHESLVSSNSVEWETPDWLFKQASVLFGPFDLDAAATPLNAKCKRYFTEADNALEKDWNADRVWLNPPYGRTKTVEFVLKAIEEVRNNHCNNVCMLLPARTDTAWFHTLLSGEISGLSVFIVFIKGRVRFQNAMNSAPFPPMLIVIEHGKSSIRVVSSEKMHIGEHK